MILFLVSSISTLVEKQSKRLQVHDITKITHSSLDRTNEEKQSDSVIAKENYFTLPKVTKVLCDKGMQTLYAR